MHLRIDPDRQVTPSACDHCGSEHLRICGFINSEHGAFAIYHASLYDHDGVHEAYVDVVMDDVWNDSPLDPGPNRTTFGCRVGPVEGAPAPACSLVRAARFQEGNPFYGERLDRERALPHPWLPLFWETMDHLLEHEPDVHSHVYCVNAAPQEN